MSSAEEHQGEYRSKVEHEIDIISLDCSAASECKQAPARKGLLWRLRVHCGAIQFRVNAFAYLKEDMEGKRASGRFIRREIEKAHPASPLKCEGK